MIGLGHVGSRVAKLCAKDGAKLVLADVDRSKRKLAEELGASWTTPDRALDADVDVLAPCALGGFLDDESVPRLRCRVIAGAANNQLADDRIADLLADRGDPVGAGLRRQRRRHHQHRRGARRYDPANARRRVRGIADTLGEIFDHARRSRSLRSRPPTQLARERLRA